MATQPLGQRGQKKSYWKQVLIGGTPGILLGSAAAFGADKLMAADEITVEAVDGDETFAEAELCAVPGASSVSDDMSFAEAFAAARAEVGPGGTFEWRGNVYGTYYANEWNAMNPQQQNDFASEIIIGVPGTEDTVTVPTEVATTTETPVTPEPPVETAQVVPDRNSEHVADSVEHTDVAVTPAETPAEIPAETPVEPQLAFTPLSVQTITNEDGSTSTIGVVMAGDHVAYLIDADNDGIFDALTADINGDGTIGDDEIEILTDQSMTVNDFYAWLGQTPGEENYYAGDVDYAATETPDCGEYDTPDATDDIIL